MELILRPPADVPTRFFVTITDASSPEELSAVVNVAVSHEADSSDAEVRRYLLTRNDHQSFLDFYEQLAHDFGLRNPVSRQPAPKPSSDAIYHPLLTRNLAPGILYGYGDPAVLRVTNSGGAAYYMVCTSNDAPDSFPILRSTDLRRWEHLGYVFPRGQKPPWVLDGPGLGDFWAPELHRAAGEYRVYFVARHCDGGDLSIGFARSDAPDGPFTALPEPILRGGTIDPHVFIDDGGEMYLFWKQDSNGVWPTLLSDLLHREPGLVNDLFVEEQDRRTASFLATLGPWLERLRPMERFFAEQPLIEAVRTDFARFERRIGEIAVHHAVPATASALAEVRDLLKTPMFVRRLTQGGTEFEGPCWKVLENDQPWEGHVVEGIWVVKHQGRYFMFYAGNDFSTADYAVNIAVADSPVGPYVKSLDRFVRSTGQWSGPGHPSVARGLDGRHILFLHAYFPGHAGYKEFRACVAAPFVFEDGFPRLVSSAELPSQSVP